MEIKKREPDILSGTGSGGRIVSTKVAFREKDMEKLIQISLKGNEEVLGEQKELLEGKSREDST